MAGAVVLFPDMNDSASLEDGRCCAEALGLAYFITWTATEVTFWDSRPAIPVPGKQITLQRATKSSSANFQEALQQLMEAAKTMSVVGAVPPPELSAYYLANLYSNTLIAVRPLLMDASRVARIQQQSPADEPDAEIHANGKAILTLVRLLSLILQDQPPVIAQPEDLEPTLFQFLLAESLPPELHKALQRREEESLLPEEAAVRFHLLFRRLTQLRVAADGPRHALALGLLLKHEHVNLGGFSLPFPLQTGEGVTILLNPDGLYAEVSPCLEIASTPILAMTALLRHLQKAATTVEQVSDLWQISPSTTPVTISGTLVGRRFPSAEWRHNHFALLRTSWPTRRFKLPPRTPEWSWSFLHLLGLAADGATIELRLSDRWLSSHFGKPIIDLIKELFTLDQLDQNQDGWLSLRLFKTELADHLTNFSLKDGSKRQVSWDRLKADHPAMLILALSLPEELFDLLETGRLRLLRENTWPEGHENALYLYTRSRLGRFLWQLVSGNRSLPGIKSLRQDLLQTGLPVPESAALSRLNQLGKNDGKTVLSDFEVDQELALWLGKKLELPAAPTSENTRLSSKTEPGKNELIEQISERVFVDGIPLFPTHYLFDYYRPKLMEYVFEAPLVLGNQFFDTYELHDAGGQALQIDGSERAQALLLASAATSGTLRISLPADQQILAAVLDRYLMDLQNLRQSLLLEIHRIVSNPQTADNLAETIWTEQELPPWALVSKST